MEDIIRYESAGAHLIEQDLDAEVILVDLTTKSYFSLAESAIVLWKMLSKGYSKDEMLGCLDAVFSGKQEEFEQAFDSLTADLIASGVIVPARDQSAPSDFLAQSDQRLAVDESGVKKEFRAPQIEKFVNLEFPEEAEKRKRQEEAADPLQGQGIVSMIYVTVCGALK